MMPVLYFLPPSPPCRSVMMLGRILGVEFELKTVNIMEGEHLKPDFLSLNPQHCIPTMDDHGLVLWESRAIMMYLVSMYSKDDDKLYPKDVRTRAMVDQRIQFDLGTLFARFADYFLPVVFMGAMLDETKKARLVEATNWLETILKGRQFLATDNFTIADLTTCVTISQMEAFDFELGPFPRIRAWFARCKDFLEPFGYEEINQAGCDQLAGIFRAKIHKS